MKWWALLIMALTVFTTQEVAGSRILFIGAISSKSLFGYFNALSNSLADNGHQVTLVSPFKPSKARANIREVFLEDLEVTKVLPNVFSGNFLAAHMSLVGKIPDLCSDALQVKEVQDLLKEEFDLGLISFFFSDCFLSLFHQLKIPYIYVSTTPLMGPYATMMGVPQFPSFVSSPVVHFPHPLTFPQRVLNAIGTFMADGLINGIVIPRIEGECRRRGLCPQDLPNLMSVRENTSAILVNSVRGAETPPRPTMPNVVYIGGIHCKDAKPLPKDLDEWIAGSGKDGFIFFSLGSIVKPSSMPDEYRRILLKVFGSLKQRVLWKWGEDTMADLPPNVRLGKWLPQQDILGDSRLRLFITHGGALSTQESIYHGTPILGLPVFDDQQANMKEMQEQGWCLSLDWGQLEERKLKESILSVIEDKKMRAEVKRRSTLMRDVSQDPHQVLDFWVQYVIRHKGAHHLKSPILSMKWYQVYNVDVWLTVLGVILVVSYILVKILLAICRCCCSSKSKAKKD